MSVLLEHKQNHYLKMSKFEKAMGLYTDLTGMSRNRYEALWQIL